jgi:hypothetical protein
LPEKTECLNSAAEKIAGSGISHNARTGVFAASHEALRQNAVR